MFPLVLQLLFLAPLVSNRPTKESLDSLDELIEQVITCHGLAGLSLTVVQDGITLLHRGYGFSDLSNKTPVTPDTLYAVGSLSKQFTSLLLEYYQQQGLIDLTEPLSPQFRRVNRTFNITSGWLNEEISVEDMLSHSTGLPGYMGLEFLANYTRDQLFQKLFYSDQDTKLAFRGSWEYNNWLYAAAARAGEIMSGRTYEQDLQHLIFDNIGMTGSGSLSDHKFIRDNLERIAKPYFYDRGENHLITDMLWFTGWNEAMTPAGGLLLSGRDMSKWMKFLLSGGQVNGKQKMMEPATISDMFRSLNNQDMTQYLTEIFPGWSSRCYGYGLGWFLYECKLGRGGIEYGHSGNLYDVHYSKISLYPESNTGVFFAFSGGNSSYNRELGAILDIIISEIVPNGKLDAAKSQKINEMLESWGCKKKRYISPVVSHKEHHRGSGGGSHVKFLANGHQTTSTHLHSRYKLPDKYLGTYKHQFLGKAELKRESSQVVLVLNDMWTSKVSQIDLIDENNMSLHCYFDSIPWIPSNHKDDSHNKMTINVTSSLHSDTLIMTHWSEYKLTDIVFNRYNYKL